MATQNRVNRTQKHIEVAKKLQSWAESTNCLNDPYVRQILDSLIQKRNWATWASLNPFELLPHPSATKKNFITSLSIRVNVLRNVLVFAPVALTWSAVSHASHAFQIYTASNPNSVANFLEFWQNGYGVLSKEWRIGNVANLDFLIVLIIITLTLFTSVATVLTNKKQSEVEDTFEMERAEVGLALFEFFFDKQKATTFTVNSGINNSIQNLKNATQKLEQATKILNKKIQL